MSEFAQVISGVVTDVIVSSAAEAATLPNGPWISTPAKVGKGYLSNGASFLSPLPAALALNTGDTLIINAHAVTPSIPSYQWNKDGVDIVGKTSAALSIVAVAGSYSVSITCGSDSIVSNPCVVTVS